MAQISLEDWDEMWSPVLCLPSDGTKDKVAAAARTSDPYVDPAPASLRLESRQLMTQASGAASLPGATSRHPGHTRLPSAPTAELRWLCTTGNLIGRRVSVYWPKDDLWYDGTVDNCQPGRFRLTYDSNRTHDPDSTEPPVVRWEALGIGVHLLTRLPAGETMRKMFTTRSRTVNGRGRPVLTAPRVRQRQSSSVATASSSPVSPPSAAATVAASAPEAELDPTALAVLMAPSFRVEDEPGPPEERDGNGTAAVAKSAKGRGRGRGGGSSQQPKHRPRKSHVEVESGSDGSESDADDETAYKEWTPKEEALLRQVSISIGPGKWEEKVATMKTKRTWMSIAIRYGTMVRRQKSDPLLRKGFRQFSPSPSSQELKAARSALGMSSLDIPRKCEECGGLLDSSYGVAAASGRFCSQSCKNRSSAKRKHVANAAAPSKPSKQLRQPKPSSGSSSSEDESDDDDENEKEEVDEEEADEEVVDEEEEDEEDSGDEEESRSCQHCSQDMARPYFGTGRFCNKTCKARFASSRKIRSSALQFRPLALQLKPLALSLARSSLAAAVPSCERHSW